MNDKMEEARKKSLEEALARYVRHIGRAAAALNRLSQWAEDMGEVSPDDVNWGHAGDAKHIADELEGLVAFIDYDEHTDSD